ncbi:hypothetical protein V6N11_005043 [Hibiscus sabdariffa]|uniref:Uncharacterized protein n=1 Tax=Hibiscus sabdariffa TaxID=183260 RepID=A0ABR2N671_9ROSI
MIADARRRRPRRDVRVVFGLHIDLDRAYGSRFTVLDGVKAEQQAASEGAQQRILDSGNNKGDNHVVKESRGVDELAPPVSHVSATNVVRDHSALLIHEGLQKKSSGGGVLKKASSSKKGLKG